MSTDVRATILIMSERKEAIIKAAFQVFSRYGLKRTTMNDIAEEAGLSRQTLYNFFANKDELLRATIRLHADRAIAAIEAECAGIPDLGDKLDVVFNRLVVVPWVLVHAAPHGDEILSGVRDVARQEIALADSRYEAMLETILAPYAGNLSAAGMTVDQLCDLIQRSWYGIRHKARDRDHLDTLLVSLKALVLNAARSR